MTVRSSISNFILLTNIEKKPSSTIMYVQLADVYGSVTFVYSTECYTALLFHFISPPQAVLASFVLRGARRIAKRYLDSCICRSQSLLQQYLWTTKTTCMLLDQTTRTSKFSFWQACLHVSSTLSFLILHTSSWHSSNSKLPGVWSKINSWTHKFPLLQDFVDDRALLFNWLRPPQHHPPSHTRVSGHKHNYILYIYIYIYI